MSTFTISLHIVSNEQDIIREALDRWQEKTCIQFSEIKIPTPGVHYLRFIKGDV